MRLLIPIIVTVILTGCGERYETEQLNSVCGNLNESIEQQKFEHNDNRLNGHKLVLETLNNGCYHELKDLLTLGADPNQGAVNAKLKDYAERNNDINILAVLNEFGANSSAESKKTDPVKESNNLTKQAKNNASLTFCETNEVEYKDRVIKYQKFEFNALKGGCESSYSKLFTNGVNKKQFTVNNKKLGSVDAFVFASLYDLPELKKWLLNNQYDINLSKPSISVLIDNGFSDIAEQLIIHGHEINKIKTTGKTLLELVAQSMYKHPSNSKLLKPIIEAGANIPANPHGFFRTIKRTDKKNNTRVLYELASYSLNSTQSDLINGILDEEKIATQKILDKENRKLALKIQKRKMKLFSKFVDNAEKGKLNEIKESVDLGLDLTKPYYGGAALIKAAEKNQTPIMAYLLDNGVSANSKSYWYNGSCSTALFQAVTSGKIKAVKLLIESGASINQMGHFNGKFYSPLSVARLKNDTDMASLIEQANGVPLTGDDIKTFEQALIQGDVEQLSLLVAKGFDLNQGECQKATTLIAKNLNKIIDAGTLDPVMNFIAKNGFTFAQNEHELIRFAGNLGSLKLVDFLISNGSDVNARPLKYYLNNIDLPKYTDTSYTKYFAEQPDSLLFSALWNRDDAMIERLLRENNLILNTVDATNSELAITQAIRLAQFKTANLLLSDSRLTDYTRWWGRGANKLPSTQTSNSGALHLSCKLGDNNNSLNVLHGKIPQKDYKHYSNALPITGPIKCSPLSWAIRYEQYDLVSLLLNKNFSVTPIIHTDKSKIHYIGRSILDYAIIAGDFDAAKLLINHGADPKNSAVLAVAYNHHEILNYLIKHGVNLKVKVPSLHSRGGGIQPQPLSKLKSTSSEISYTHVYDDGNPQYSENWLESLLTLAAYMPNNKIILTMLIEEGIDIKHKVEGKTALDIAIQLGNKENIEILTFYGLERS